jgi:hypothetical protein
LITKLEYRLVDAMPDELEEGVLYHSPRFRVSMHACCCGCKNKVVTPLSPVRWKLTFDGQTISLYPSIGNWNFECKSHYWIIDSVIEWAGTWSNDEIAEGKKIEREKRAEYYTQVNSTINKSNLVPKQKQSWASKIIRRIKKIFA